MSTSVAFSSFDHQPATSSLQQNSAAFRSKVWSSPSLPFHDTFRFSLVTLPYKKAQPGNSSFISPCRSSASEVCETIEAEAFCVTETGSFTVSDETLLERGFALHCSIDGIDLDQLNNVFVKVGFPRRQKEKLERALEHTSSLRWLEELKSGKLIAFARATGDGVFNAIIWDVVVDPSYQGLGLGKAIMERLMVDLLQKGITNIGLYAEPNVVNFYKPLGYIPDPQGIRAMAYSRKGK